jgi:hypothetical protein
MATMYGIYVATVWGGIVDICMTVHMRAFDFFYTIAH